MQTEDTHTTTTTTTSTRNHYLTTGLSDPICQEFRLCTALHHHHLSLYTVATTMVTTCTAPRLWLPWFPLPPRPQPLLRRRRHLHCLHHPPLFQWPGHPPPWASRTRLLRLSTTGTPRTDLSTPINSNNNSDRDSLDPMSLDMSRLEAVRVGSSAVTSIIGHWILIPSRLWQSWPTWPTSSVKPPAVALQLRTTTTTAGL